MNRPNVYVVTIEYLPDAEYPTSEVWRVYASREDAIKNIRKHLTDMFPDNKIKEILAESYHGCIDLFEVLGNKPEDYAIMVRAEVLEMPLR